MVILWHLHITLYPGAVVFQYTTVVQFASDIFATVLKGGMLPSASGEVTGGGNALKPPVKLHQWRLLPCYRRVGKEMTCQAWRNCQGKSGQASARPPTSHFPTKQIRTVYRLSHRSGRGKGRGGWDAGGPRLP